MDIAKELGIPTQKEAVHYTDLAHYDEICFSNATQGVIEVNTVKNTPHLRSQTIVQHLSDAYWNKNK